MSTKEKTYDISIPLYKQVGIDESIALPYQQCINGLLIGRTINIIGPKDFDRHIHRTIVRLLKIKEQQQLQLGNKIYKINAS
jgi:hypothetical protein